MRLLILLSLVLIGCGDDKPQTPQKTVFNLWQGDALLDLRYVEIFPADTQRIKWTGTIAEGGCNCQINFDPVSTPLKGQVVFAECFRIGFGAMSCGFLDTQVFEYGVVGQSLYFCNTDPLSIDSCYFFY